MNNAFYPHIPAAELISSLADGEITGEDLGRALKACQESSQAMSDWNSYHLIGEVLRSPKTALAGADAGFIERLNGRLAVEMKPVLNIPPTLSMAAPAEASNDGNFRWKLVAGFASLAAVSAVVWNIAGSSATAPGAQLAQAQAQQQVVVASPAGPIIRDARLQELLAAHRQMGGTSALQEPSGFLRNATFETPRDGRR